MIQIFATFCLIGAAGLLVALSVIDLRVRLLPDKLVFPFGVLGVFFHSMLSFQYLSPFDMLIGATLGFTILYGIRFVANRIYRQDTLGLGDVKLMLAAGLWLGPDAVLVALTLGAICGLFHGLGTAAFKTILRKEKFNLSRLEVPAGPGFAVGIALVGIYKFHTLFSVIG